MDSDMKKCEVCGELYSTTYHTCPFCQEEAAMQNGKPMHRHASDFRNKRGGHAFGVMLLVLALVVVGVGTAALFGDNIAAFLGMRETTGDGTGDGISSIVSDGSNSTSQNYEDPYDPSYNVDASTPDTAVTVSQDSLSLEVGGTAQLSAADGGGTYTWTSADPSVATVSESGTVTGVGNGNTQVTVSDGFTTASCIVRIKGVTASTTTPTTPSGSATLKLNREDMTMPAGTTFQLKVSGTASAVTWSMADTSIATIDADGTVHFVKKGTTTATASVDGQTLQCIVRVK